ncbi:MAG: plastocyanin/azurin family copper-binding protein [Actinomycetota bacterium]|nr:plastocyanin/azurin family copper-binding protein [Actinomycetota bacterium]
MNLPTLASGPPPTKTQAQRSVSPMSKISIMLAAAVVAFVGAIAPAVLAATPVTVMIGATLNPKEITIRPGTLVIWSNEDSERHRVRSTTGPVGFDSGNLDPGESFSFTFNAAGTFPYFCTLHPDMVGAITVTGEATGRADTESTTSDENPDDVVGSTEGTGDPGSDTSAPSSDKASVVVDVDAIDSDYKQRDLTVELGTTVRWTNIGALPHTVTDRNGSFDSGLR